MHAGLIVTLPFLNAQPISTACLILIKLFVQINTKIDVKKCSKILNKRIFEKLNNHVGIYKQCITALPHISAPQNNLIAVHHSITQQQWSMAVHYSITPQQCTIAWHHSITTQQYPGIYAWSQRYGLDAPYPQMGVFQYSILFFFFFGCSPIPFQYSYPYPINAPLASYLFVTSCKNTINVIAIGKKTTYQNYIQAGRTIRFSRLAAEYT